MLMEKYAQPVFGGQDFRQFYAGAQLLAEGRNPYDREQVARIQQIDWYPTVHVSVSPPSSFLPYLPLAPLPYAAAMYAHAALNVLLLSLAVIGWRRLLFSHQPGLTKCFLAGMWIWMPVMLLVAIGQVTAMVLIGMTGWLWAMRSGRPAWAGAALVLCWIKPHLGVMLIGFALCYALRRRGWPCIASFTLLTLLLFLLPMWFRPQVYAEWRSWLGASPPTQWLTSTIQAWGRNYVSPIFYEIGWGLWGLGALTGLIGGWRSAAQPERLVRHGLLLLNLNLMVAIHAYSYDFVLLLPGFLLGFGLWWLHKRPAALLWLALNAAFFSVKVLGVINEWDLWTVSWLALPLNLWLMHSWPLSAEARTHRMPITS